MGQRHIGVAVSDEMKFIAQSLLTIQRDAHYEWMKTVQETVRQKEIEEIVVGYPIKMSGDIGTSAKEVEEIKEKLKDLTGIPVILWDERLSTVQAEKILIDVNIKRKKRKKIIDQMAAVIILQAYLDSLKH
jgi:putative Holliday junction resolvase